MRKVLSLTNQLDPLLNRHLRYGILIHPVTLYPDYNDGCRRRVQQHDHQNAYDISDRTPPLHHTVISFLLFE